MIKRTGTCTGSPDTEQNCVFSDTLPLPCVVGEDCWEDKPTLRQFEEAVVFREQDSQQFMRATCKLDAITEVLLPKALLLNPWCTLLIITTLNWLTQFTWRVLLATKQHLSQMQWKITLEPMPFIALACQPSPQSLMVSLHHAAICLPLAPQ